MFKSKKIITEETARNQRAEDQAKKIAYANAAIQFQLALNGFNTAGSRWALNFLEGDSRVAKAIQRWAKRSADRKMGIVDVKTISVRKTEDMPTPQEAESDTGKPFADRFEDTTGQSAADRFTGDQGDKRTR